MKSWTMMTMTTSPPNLFLAWLIIFVGGPGIPTTTTTTTTFGFSQGQRVVPKKPGHGDFVSSSSSSNRILPKQHQHQRQQQLPLRVATTSNQPEEMNGDDDDDPLDLELAELDRLSRELAISLKAVASAKSLEQRKEAIRKAKSSLDRLDQVRNQLAALEEIQIPFPEEEVVVQNETPLALAARKTTTTTTTTTTFPHPPMAIPKQEYFLNQNNNDTQRGGRGTNTVLAEPPSSNTRNGVYHQTRNGFLAEPPPSNTTNGSYQKPPNGERNTVFSQPHPFNARKDDYRKTTNRAGNTISKESPPSNSENRAYGNATHGGNTVMAKPPVSNSRSLVPRHKRLNVKYDPLQNVKRPFVGFWNDLISWPGVVGKEPHNNNISTPPPPTEPTLHDLFKSLSDDLKNANLHSLADEFDQIGSDTKPSAHRPISLHTDPPLRQTISTPYLKSPPLRRHVNPIKERIPRYWAETLTLVKQPPVTGRRRKWFEVQAWAARGQHKNHQQDDMLWMLGGRRLPRHWAALKTLQHQQQESHTVPTRSYHIPRYWYQMLLWTIRTATMPPEQVYRQTSNDTVSTTVNATASTETAPNAEDDLPDTYQRIMAWAQRQPVPPTMYQILYLLRVQRVAAAAQVGQSRWGILETQRAESMLDILFETEEEADESTPKADAERPPPSLPDRYQIIFDWAQNNNIRPTWSQIYFLLRNLNVAAAAQSGKSRWGPLETQRSVSLATSLLPSQDTTTVSSSTTLTNVENDQTNRDNNNNDTEAEESSTLFSAMENDPPTRDDNNEETEEESSTVFSAMENDPPTWDDNNEETEEESSTLFSTTENDPPTWDDNNEEPEEEESSTLFSAMENDPPAWGDNNEEEEEEESSTVFSAMENDPPAWGDNNEGGESTVETDEPLPKRYQAILDWAARQGSAPTWNQILYLLRTQNVAAAADVGNSRWGNLENQRAALWKAALFLDDIEVDATLPAPGPEQHSFVQTFVDELPAPGPEALVVGSTDLDSVEKDRATDNLAVNTVDPDSVATDPGKSNIANTTGNFVEELTVVGALDTAAATVNPVSAQEVSLARLEDLFFTDAEMTTCPDAVEEVQNSKPNDIHIGTDFSAAAQEHMTRTAMILGNKDKVQDTKGHTNLAVQNGPAAALWDYSGTSGEAHNLKVNNGLIIQEDVLANPTKDAFSGTAEDGLHLKTDTNLVIEQVHTGPTEGIDSGKAEGGHGTNMVVSITAAASAGISASEVKDLKPGTNMVVEKDAPVTAAVPTGISASEVKDSKPDTNLVVEKDATAAASAGISANEVKDLKPGTHLVVEKDATAAASAGIYSVTAEIISEMDPLAKANDLTATKSESEEDEIIPDRYRVIYDWALRQKDLPNWSKVLFLYRSQHVAERAIAGESRWGFFENQRASLLAAALLAVDTELDASIPAKGPGTFGKSPACLSDNQDTPTQTEPESPLPGQYELSMAATKELPVSSSSIESSSGSASKSQHGDQSKTYEKETVFISQPQVGLPTEVATKNSSSSIDVPSHISGIVHDLSSQPPSPLQSTESLSMSSEWTNSNRSQEPSENHVAAPRSQVINDSSSQPPSPLQSTDALSMSSEWTNSNRSREPSENHVTAPQSQVNNDSSSHPPSPLQSTEALSMSSEWMNSNRSRDPSENHLAVPRSQVNTNEGELRSSIRSAEHLQLSTNQDSKMNQVAARYSSSIVQNGAPQTQLKSKEQSSRAWGVRNQYMSGNKMISDGMRNGSRRPKSADESSQEWDGMDQYPSGSNYVALNSQAGRRNGGSQPPPKTPDALSGAWSPVSHDLNQRAARPSPGNMGDEGSPREDLLREWATTSQGRDVRNEPRVSGPQMQRGGLRNGASLAVEQFQLVTPQDVARIPAQQVKRRSLRLKAGMSAPEPEQISQAPTNMVARRRRLPGNYEAVMRWAMTIEVPPSEHQIIFQLRNQNVAAYAAMGKSRWGDPENRRAAFDAYIVRNSILQQ